MASSICIGLSLLGLCLSFLTMRLYPHRPPIAGGGAAEIHTSRLLSQYAQTLDDMEVYCSTAYADALKVIPAAGVDKCY